MLDLDVTPLYLEDGQPAQQADGLRSCVASQIPRVRAADRLVLQISQTSAIPDQPFNAMPPNLVRELLSRMNAAYAARSGPVHEGMQRMAEELNNFIYNRNLRQTRQETAQTLGQLNMAVLHGNTLHLAQAGIGHIFLIQNGRVEHFRETGGERGLGLQRAVKPRFLQRELSAEAVLVLADHLPEHWSHTLLGAANQMEADAFGQSLIGEERDLEAAIVRFRNPAAMQDRAYPPAEQGYSYPERSAQASPEFVSDPIALPVSLPAGRGSQPAALKPQAEMGEPLVEVDILTEQPPRATEADEQRAPWVVAPEPPRERRMVTFALPAGAAMRAVQLEEELQEAEEAFSASLPEPQFVVEPRRTAQPARAYAEPAQDSHISEARRERVRRMRGVAPRPGNGLGFYVAQQILLAAGGVAGWLFNSLRTLIARKLLARVETRGQINKTAMLAVSLVIPLLVVGSATAMYLVKGRALVQDSSFLTAQELAGKGFATADRTQRRELLNQSLDWLAKSQPIGDSRAQNELRDRVQRGLDELDGLLRVEFKPALAGSLGGEVKISRMLPVGTDIYLLNAARGNVLRLYRSGQGYEKDKSFVCEPGSYSDGMVQVGSLVDIAPMPPRNAANAAILGIDGQGRTLLCGPSVAPTARVLKTPGGGWNQPTRAIQLNGYLYVLDGSMDQVHVYIFDQADQSFSAAPDMYFNRYIPHLTDVIDLAADKEYLYLLHRDGSLTACVWKGDSPQCDDPAPYRETREGFPADPLRFPQAEFVLMQSNQPPDPMIYILDGNGPALYSFSQRKLNLQRVYAAQKDLTIKPDAFAISANRRAVLVSGGDLYMASLP